MGTHTKSTALAGVVWMLGSAVPVATFSPSALAADPFAASVLACAAESDRDHRLDCYDRAVAAFTQKLSEGRRTPSAAAPAAASASSGVSTTATAASGTAAAASPAGAEANGVGAPPAKNAAATAPLPRHLSAKVTRIDYIPEHMVVYLDNDQIWQQVSESTGDLRLHTGDTVSIDKQMGSYWLSSAKGGAVQVKIKTADTPAP